MTAVKIDLQGLQQWQALMHGFPEIANKHLAAATYDSVELLYREINERTPTGANQLLRKSEHLQVTGKNAGVFRAGEILGVVGTSLNYAIPVELGTKPHTPPLTPLIDWALKTQAVGQYSSLKTKRVVRHKKGSKAQLSQVAQATIIAKRVQAIIKRKGTEGAFMFRDGFKQVEPYVKARFQQALADAIAEIAAGGKA